ncbi:hypothetical protein EZS27_027854 [termite gut metagenome]|uniref:Uncharacterized protein n=1 Tax=termite gut metagenome TaxID=433724 RepID=A0A5J4QL36_9ZZZZ
MNMKKNNENIEVRYNPIQVRTDNNRIVEGYAVIFNSGKRRSWIQGNNQTGGVK